MREGRHFTRQNIRKNGHFFGAVSSSSSSFFFFYNFIYLFLAVLGLHCCSGFSLVLASGGYSLVAVHGFLIVVAFLVVEHKL